MMVIGFTYLTFLCSVAYSISVMPSSPDVFTRQTAFAVTLIVSSMLSIGLTFSKRSLSLVPWLCAVNVGILSARVHLQEDYPTLVGMGKSLVRSLDISLLVLNVLNLLVCWSRADDPFSRLSADQFAVFEELTESFHLPPKVAFTTAHTFDKDRIERFQRLTRETGLDYDKALEVSGWDPERIEELTRLMRSETKAHLSPDQPTLHTQTLHALMKTYMFSEENAREAIEKVGPDVRKALAYLLGEEEDAEVQGKWVRVVATQPIRLRLEKTCAETAILYDENGKEQLVCPGEWVQVLSLDDRLTSVKIAEVHVPRFGVSGFLAQRFLDLSTVQNVNPDSGNEAKTSCQKSVEDHVDKSREKTRKIGFNLPAHRLDASNVERASFNLKQYHVNKMFPQLNRPGHGIIVISKTPEKAVIRFYDRETGVVDPKPWSVPRALITIEGEEDEGAKKESSFERKKTESEQSCA